MMSKLPECVSSLRPGTHSDTVLQIQKAWEVLVAKQPAFQKEPAASILRGLIAKRLLGKFSDTERQAVGKQIFKVENKWGDSYCMLKVLKHFNLP